MNHTLPLPSHLDAQPVLSLVRLIALLRSKYKDSVAQAIDRADSDFRYAATNILTFDQPLTETISYQVTHNNIDHCQYQARYARRASGVADAFLDV